MHCPKCNRQYEDYYNSSVCADCNCPLVKDETEGGDPPPEEPKPPKKPETPKKPKTPKRPKTPKKPKTPKEPKPKILLIILISVLAVSALTVAGILIYQHFKIDPPQPPVEETTSEEPTEAVSSGIIHDGIPFTVNTSKKGIISTLAGLEDVHDSAISIAGQIYHFPLLYDCFNKSDQWQCEETSGGEFITCHGKNNVTVLVCKTAGLFPEDESVSGTVVTEFMLQNNEKNSSEAWILPGGITAGSTAADVLSVYGDPNNTSHFTGISFSTETTLVYQSQAGSQMSFTFAFAEDGTIVSVIIDAPETVQNKTQDYNNPFFKLTLPGYWTNRYLVTVDKDANSYEFRYIGGGHLFTLFVHDISETFPWTMTESAIGRITGGGKTYELICRFPTDDQSPGKGRDEFYLLANSVTLEYIKAHIAPVNGYKTEVIDYSAFLGHYSADAQIEYEQGKELIVSKTKGEWITFSFGIYGGNHVQELKDVEIQVSNGEADFLCEDSMGCDCKGHIKLSEGTVVIKVEGASDPMATELYTDGELTMYRSAVIADRPLRTFIKLSKGTTADILVNDNTKYYIGWEMLDLVYAFGKEPSQYYDEENLYYYEEEPDLVFEIQKVARNYPAAANQQSVTRVILFGDHSLGSGLCPEMTLYELLGTFGASEFPSTSSQGGYFYTVYDDGYEYSFYWEGDYNEPSEYVYITKSIVR